MDERGRQRWSLGSGVRYVSVGSGRGSRRRKKGMQRRGRRILSANAPVRPSSVAVYIFIQLLTYVKVLDCHGLVTSETRYRLMRTMSSVFSLCLLVAVILRAVDHGVIAVDVHVVDQVASLDLTVASLGLVWALYNEVVQDVEEEFRG